MIDSRGKQLDENDTVVIIDWDRPSFCEGQMVRRPDGWYIWTPKGVIKLEAKSCCDFKETIFKVDK